MKKYTYAMKRACWVLAIVILALVTLAGCSRDSNLHDEWVNDEFGAIYNDDDFLTGSKTRNNMKDMQNELPDYFSVERLTGSDDVLRLSVPEEGGVFSIDYEMTVYDGKFKLLLVHVDSSFILLVEGTGSGSEIFALEAGNYSLRVVGVNGKAEVQTSLTATENITATVPGFMAPDETIILHGLASVGG